MSLMGASAAGRSSSFWRRGGDRVMGGVREQRVGSPLRREGGLGPVMVMVRALQLRGWLLCAHEVRTLQSGRRGMGMDIGGTFGGTAARASYGVSACL
jgi:hypothetical protein